MTELFKLFMKGSCAILLFLLCLPIVAQDWQTTNIDTFLEVNANRIRIVPSGNMPALAIRQLGAPGFSREYFVQGDIFYENPETAVVLFAFGYGDSLWAAGYSLVEQHIFFSEIARSDSAQFQLRNIAAKPVEIRDSRPLYVYRIIFLHQTNELQIEANGVPMRVPAPFPTQRIDRFGYLVYGSAVEVQPLKIEGKN